MQEAWKPQERKKRAKKCKNPKGFTMKQFCKNIKTRSKKGRKKNLLESELSDSQVKVLEALIIETLHYLA